MKYLILVFALLGLDQATKWWARYDLVGVMEVIPQIVFRFSENTGIAFSLPLPVYVTIPLTLAVILFIAWQLWSKVQVGVGGLALVLILAGAIGNFIDRVFYGAVTDFISVLQFPIFNVADSLISVGVVFYLWNEIFAQ